MLSILALVAAGLTACASSGKPVDRTVSHTERLTSAYQNLGASAAGVKAAADALRGSVEAKGIINREKVAVADIDKAFKRYRESVADVRSAQKKVTSSRSSLRKSVEAYFASWDKEIAAFDSDTLRSSAQSRRQDASESYVKLSEALDEGAAKVEAYLSRLSQLDAALVYDLTPAGVSALDDQLAQAGTDGEKTAEVAETLAGKLREYSETLASGKPPVPAPAP